MSRAEVTELVEQLRSGKALDIADLKSQAFFIKLTLLSNCTI